MTQSPQENPATPDAPQHVTVAFGGGGVNPIPTAARLVLGIGELAEQVGERFATPGAVVLEVTGLQAGRPGETTRLALVTLLAGAVPGIGRDGLLHLITRLAEQIAAEAGTAATVTTADVAPSATADDDA